MTFNAEQIAQLEAKLDPANVKRNPRGFDYVEGWHAIAEANRIFGRDGWSRETFDLRQAAEYQHDGKWRVSYLARVRVTAGGVVRDGSGYGSGIDKDLGQAHESALKEAETDAMKRALMTFGNPFGLALYDKTKADVGSEEKAPPAPPRAATLAERADRLEATLKAVKTAVDLDKAFKLASGLCADLDAKDPERLAEITKLYDERRDELSRLVA